jgi:hypothetical protein
MIDRSWVSQKFTKSIVEVRPVVTIVFALKPWNVKIINIACYMVQLIEEVGQVLNWKIVVAEIQHMQCGLNLT